MNAGSGPLTGPKARAALLGLLLVAGLARVLAVFTLNVNWDEFALLHRAVTTARTGDLIGGGRPGLATLLLVPFAAFCRNTVDTIVQARLLWTGIVVTAAIVFWMVLSGLLRDSSHRWAAVATGVGLWVLAPPFLHSSTQVRTDQPAILFGLFGALALLASRRRMLWAVTAGLMFGVGFLFSQKLLYVGGLAIILAVGRLAIRREWIPAREMVRVAVAGTTFLVVVLGYREMMGQLVGTPALLPVSGGLASFDHYREVVGWWYYRRMLPVLIPQSIVLAALAVATGAWLRNPGRHGPQLATGWAVVAVGTAVMVVHAGRFPYFYMTLGLFPATIGALVVGPVLDRLGSRFGRSAFLALLWIPLGGLAAMQAGAFSLDSQGHQRESLKFVHRNFTAEARGFQAHGAFVCHPDPNPFPVRFYHRVRTEFGGEEGRQHADDLLAEFRRRPVAYMIPPDERGYPQDIHEFWRTRYVRYYGPLHVPGRFVRGGPGWAGDFEVIVPGRYKWWATSDSVGTLEVDGWAVEPGMEVVLDRQGIYGLALPNGGAGLFVLALPQPPTPDTTSFYRGF